MSAGLLSALPVEADATPDQIALFRFLLALHPFAATYLAAQWLDDPIRAVIHQGACALVLEESPHLCRILTVEDFEKDGKPFWIYREPALQEENSVEIFWRDRIGKTLSAPCWYGEEKPKGYRKVRLTTKIPSLSYLIELCRDSGYPWSAAGAALSRSHNPWMHPHSDKRRNVCADLSAVEGNEDSLGVPGYRQQRDGQEYFDPNHPYVPMAPARRTLVGGGIPMFQVTQEIAKHRWDDITSLCVLEIVYRRESPSKLAEKHSVPLGRLNEYARRVRKAIRRTPGNDFAR